MQAALPLARYTVFATEDLDEARDRVARIFCPHLLALEGRGARLTARHHHAPLGAVSLNYVDYGGPVTIEPGALGRFFLIQIPLAGRAEIACGREIVTADPGLASIPDPREHLAMRWQAGTPHLIVKIDREALERHVAALLDRPVAQALHFALGFDLTSGRGRAFLDYVLMLRDMVDRSDALAGSTLATAEAARLIMTLLLEAQGSNVSAWLDHRVSPAAPRHVKRAIDYLEACPEAEIDAPTLAALSGTSLRALQEGFRRFKGTTPMGYLRGVRLARVRADLTAPGTADRSVTDIALRWGFTHLGRFAETYRATYGETPSATLRKSA